MARQKRRRSPTNTPSTQRRKARQPTHALQQLQALVELGPDALLVVDPIGRITLVNRQTEVLFGYSRAELLGQPVERLIPTRFHSAHQQHRAAYTAAPRTRSMGVALPLFGRRRDGSEFPVEVRVSPMGMEATGEQFIIAAIRDVSERVPLTPAGAPAVAEAGNSELRERHRLTDAALTTYPTNRDAFLAAVLERLQTVMAVDTVTILLASADERDLRVCGTQGPAAHAVEQLSVPMGQGVLGHIAATRQPLVVDDLALAEVATPLLRARMCSLAGVPLLVENQLLGVLCVGSAIVRHFTATDVQLLQQVADRMALVIDHARLLEAEQTARREAERERVRWRAAMDSAPELVATCDADLRITYVNPAYARLRGSPADPSVPPEARAARYGLLTPDGTDFVPPEERPLARALREGQPVRGVEMLHRSPTGEERLVVWEAAPMRTPQGTLLGAVAIGHDITARRQLEREREQARTEAEQQAAQLAATFEAMADGVAVFDVQGHLLRENAAQQRLLGLEAASPDYAELPLPERMALFAARDEQDRLLGPEEGPLPRALRGEVVSGAETMDLRSRTLDGRELELNVSAAPLRDREGHLTGVVAVFRDQTERKRLERERAEQAEQLDRIFEGIADGVVVYDAQGQVVRLNAAARRLLGLDTLDALPSDYFDRPASERATSLFAPRDEQDRPLVPEERPIVRVLSGQAAGPVARDLRVRALDGRELELTVSAAPLRNREGRLVGAVHILHDRTERQRLEQEREAARAHELALQEVTRHMDEFFAAAAHDLRNPLTVAKSHVQLALRRFHRAASAVAAGTDRPESGFDPLHESLEHANLVMSRLVRFVERLFDVARARSGTLDLQLAPCDLVALVREQVEEQRTVTPDQTIALVVPNTSDAPNTSPVMVLADADRLSQVFGNYLSNALKYSPRDQPVAVQLEVAGEEARVAVRDAGPGIPAHEQQHLFEPFYRVPGVTVQTSGESGGMGLGLYICQRIVELHHGRVGVDSQVGQGSTFWFTLPLTETTS